MPGTESMTSSDAVPPAGRAPDVSNDEGGDDDGPTVFRPGGVSYLHVPAPDPARSAAFYHAVFDWAIRDDGDGSCAFQDGTGHVIGHFMPDLPVAGVAGVVPYIYVANVEESIAKVTANGGTVARSPFPEGDLWVAAFHDPAGNLIGVWQSGPRRPEGT